MLGHSARLSLLVDALVGGAGLAHVQGLLAPAADDAGEAGAGHLAQLVGDVGAGDVEAAGGG